MNQITKGTAARILALAALAALSARATQPPSLLIHNAKLKPWTLGIDRSSTSGKVKIFDQEPKYTDAGELDESGPAPVMVLRQDAQETFTLSRMQKKYWLVFYPKWGLLNLTLSLTTDPKAPGQGGTFNVKQLILPGKVSLKLELKANDTQKAQLNPNVDHFEHSQTGPLMTLN